MEIKIEERINLVEQHLKEIQKDISNISSALVGNKENGNKGFVHKIEDLTHEMIEVKAEIYNLKNDVSKKDLYISKLEYILAFIVGVIITAAITLIFKK